MKDALLRIFLVACVALIGLRAEADPVVADGKFEMRFISYDGSPGDEFRKRWMTCAIQIPGTQSAFYKIGETINGTNFRVEGFTYKELPVKGGQRDNRSELKLVDSKTGEALTLIFGQAVDVSAAHLTR